MSDRDNMLGRIKEGMKVYDKQGEEIGEVEFIHFSEGNGSEFSRAASLPDEPDKPLTDIIRKMFGTDKLPEELRERLLMHGFVRIDSAKLFGADRYVMFDQIAKVEENSIHLQVQDAEDLLTV